MALLPHTKLASQLKTSMRGINDPARAFNTFTDTVKTYFIANTELVYAWAAVNPAGAADPVVSFKTGIAIPGTLSQEPLRSAGYKAFTLFETQFEIMMSAATAEIPEEFAVPAAPFLIPALIGGSQLNQSLLRAAGNRWEDVMDEFARQIVASVLTPAYWSREPLKGTHGAFAGATISLTVT
jgi:hypothetical protein